MKLKVLINPAIMIVCTLGDPSVAECSNWFSGKIFQVVRNKPEFDSLMIENNDLRKHVLDVYFDSLKKPRKQIFESWIKHEKILFPEGADFEKTKKFFYSMRARGDAIKIEMLEAHNNMQMLLGEVMSVDDIDLESMGGDVLNEFFKRLHLLCINSSSLGIYARDIEYHFRHPDLKKSDPVSEESDSVSEESFSDPEESDSKSEKSHRLGSGH